MQVAKIAMSAVLHNKFHSAVSCFNKNTDHQLSFCSPAIFKTIVMFSFSGIKTLMGATLGAVSKRVWKRYVEYYSAHRN